MWLKYGADPRGHLKEVGDVPGGKTNLTCPYCGGRLTAKKGRVKSHHFAHAGETCKPVSARHKAKRWPGLPLYDRFNIQLPGREVERLKVLWQTYGVRGAAIPRDLIDLRWRLRGLIECDGDRAQLSDLGKIPVGALSLEKFNAVQEPLLLSEWEAYRGRAERADTANLSTADECRADLRIYEAQLRRIWLNQLYFLEVRADGYLFHKIGITRREIGDRIPEIRQDLKRQYAAVEVNLLGLWRHRGNVELYFKHRYSEFNHRIGKLTEYFRFPDVKAVLNDLHGMGPKVLSDAEAAILGES